MNSIDNNTKVFFELVKAGLWEREIQLSQFGRIDFSEVQRLSEEQAVVGLVAAGLEHVSDYDVPKNVLLQFISQTLQLEQRNVAMNDFIAHLVDKMRQSDIYTLLVKGQGIAQCYERPLWRTSGDIDFYLSRSNYENAKLFLTPLSQFIEPEDKRRLHFGVLIEPWIVELHGTMYTDISNRMNVVSDEVYHDLFFNGNVRSWDNHGVQIFLPSPTNDVIIVFNHFINHFYGEGVGLRQICDWCRLLWTFRSSINIEIINSQIKKEGLLSEWRAFASLAVDYLGMPAEAMPLYNSDIKYKKKANRIITLTIETKVPRANNDTAKGPKWKAYIRTFYRRLIEYIRISRIFRVNACKFFIIYILNRFKYVIK